MTRGSRFALFVLILCLSAFSLGPTSAQAVTLLVNGSGILTGATGVDVGGTLYDVEFLDGSCVALFTGCDAVSDFTFQTATGAQAASQALFEQVLLDGTLGNFNSDPELTRGCAANNVCVIFTPYSLTQVDNLAVANAFISFNVQSPGCCDIVQFSPKLIATDTTNLSIETYARWTVATAVPEPATLTLFGLGVAALGLWDYRRRQGCRTGTLHP